jgi:hypothetical protein
MEDTEFKKTACKKVTTTREPIKKKTKFNHLINVFVYNNIALFKGDTYPYRGTFKRCGGDFNKKFYGYLVPLDRFAECKMQISNFVESLLVYKKDQNLDIGTVVSTMIDDDLDNYHNEQDNHINSDTVIHF